MQIRHLLHSVLCACFVFVHALAWGGGEQDSAPLIPDTFGRCQFAVSESKQARISDRVSRNGEYAYCSIHLSLPSDLSNESATLFVVGRGLFERENLEHQMQGTTNNGFYHDDSRRWQFRGTDLLLASKMLKTSFSEEHIGEETLLVGNQLIKGNIAQGGPITVPGIRILRITPQFVVSVELNFQPLHYEKQTRGYKQLREVVSQELVEIVKSVQVTPGVSGPTVRSATTP